MYPYPSPDSGYRRGLCCMYRIRRTAASWQLQLAWSQHGLDFLCVWTADYDDGIVDCENAGPADRVHTFTSHKAVTQRSKQPLAPSVRSPRSPALELQDTCSCHEHQDLRHKRRRSMPRIIPGDQALPPRHAAQLFEAQLSPLLIVIALGTVRHVSIGVKSLGKSSHRDQGDRRATRRPPGRAAPSVDAGAR